MYKYKCAVSDFADENAYYAAIEKIKNFYPHYEYAEEFNEYSRAKTIIVPNKRGKPAAVRVEIDFRKSKTFVISEAYLNYIFGGRKVKNKFASKETLLKLIISAAFLIVNVAFIKSLTDSFVIYIFLMPWFILWYVLPLALVYFTAAWGMKKAMWISAAEIFFIELGGLPLILLSVISFSMPSDISLAFLAVNYITLIIPAAFIGVLIASAVTRSKSK